MTFEAVDLAIEDEAPFVTCFDHGDNSKPCGATPTQQTTVHRFDRDDYIQK